MNRRAGPRQSFTVLLDPDLMAEASEVGINISAACEAGIAQRMRRRANGKPSTRK
jgi:post-segregation antitoxin (ccd killing protein)